MDTIEVTDLLRTLRRIGGEPADVEVKNGAGGFPTSVQETIVAFANTDGGTVLIGVDESDDFAVVTVPDIASYRDSLVALTRNAITPPLHVVTDIVEVEGGLVLVAEIPPARADQKPVYVTAKGVTFGAYLRAGDGDRRMSQGEIGLLYGSRTQPHYDTDVVDGTSIDTLDRESVLRTLQRARANSASLARVPEHVALHRLGVLSEPRTDAPLTLGGLLTFGEHPQQHFPQLMVSVVVHPPEGERTARFLDNATLRGPIPALVADALAMLRRNLAARAVMSETGRTDRLEYPLEAIREVLVNALLHRDYSPLTRGTQVQVDLFPDRLVVRSPGGLYGGLVEDDLGEEGTSSSRNAVLASLLSDTYMPGSAELVAENRDSGIPTMIGLARTHGLPRPTFRSTVTSFVVTMDRSELIGPEVRAWIGRLHADLPTTSHEIALAMLRTGYVTNAMLREWGADQLTATRVPRDLVAQGLANREGGRRYARYFLDPSARDDRTEDSAPAIGGAFALIAALRVTDSITAAELAGSTAIPRNTVLRHLHTMIEQGVVAAEGAPRSPKRRYRWIGPADPGRGSA